MMRRPDPALKRYDTTPTDTDREQARAELAEYPDPAGRVYDTVAVAGLRVARTLYADSPAAAAEVARARARALFDAYLDDCASEDIP